MPGVTDEDIPWSNMENSRQETWSKSPCERCRLCPGHSCVWNVVLQKASSVEGDDNWANLSQKWHPSSLFSRLLLLRKGWKEWIFTYLCFLHKLVKIYVSHFCPFAMVLLGYTGLFQSENVVIIFSSFSWFCHNCFKMSKSCAQKNFMIMFP